MVDHPLPRPGWALDPCPPPPLVLAGELALPPGGTCPAPLLVGDVHVTRLLITAGDRARAVALCSPAGHGVLVRATAAWVWSGERSLLPRHVDLATPTNGPPIPGPRPSGLRTGLPVRASRCEGPLPWVVLGGVPLSDPARTAADCARLLNEPLARRCVQALAASPGFDVGITVARLHAGGPRPGLRQALQLLREVPVRSGPGLGRAGGDGRRPAQPSTTSRCTPLVTR